MCVKGREKKRNRRTFDFLLSVSHFFLLYEIVVYFSSNGGTLPSLPPSPVSVLFVVLVVRLTRHSTLLHQLVVVFLSRFSVFFSSVYIRHILTCYLAFPFYIWRLFTSIKYAFGHDSLFNQAFSFDTPLPGFFVSSILNMKIISIYFSILFFLLSFSSSLSRVYLSVQLKTNRNRT